MTKEEMPDGAAPENDGGVRVQHVIIYMKVNEDKEEGLVFNGPFYGPIAVNDADAKEAARELSNQTRSGAVISRIYALPHSENWSVAMEKAKPIFERIKTDMIEAKQIVDRPVIKRKKRR